MTLSITKLTFNVLNPIALFKFSVDFKRLDKSEAEGGDDGGIFASVSACHGVAAQQRRRERNSEPASAGDLT